MKKNRKYMLIILTSLIIISGASAQQSDYQIKTEFTEDYQAIDTALTNARSVVMINNLKKEIIFLENEYFEYSKLLNNAFYPATYKNKINELLTKANSVEQRLLIIENQNERIAKLSNEINYYKSEIAFLNSRADSLRKAIKSSEASEQHLAGLVKRYRENLELRDELIMDVVDSLMTTYSGMTTKKIIELADQVEFRRISSENPLDMLERIIEENTEYVSGSNRALSVEDHLRMYAVQHHFEDVWNQIGGKMLAAYGGNKKQEWNTNITSKLKDWRMATSQKMWKSMDQYLEFSDVELGAFDNNYSFFIALDSFIKEAQMKSEGEIISTESYQDYKKFQAFWSGKIKNEWSNLIQDSEVLTIAQITLIDNQLTSWESEARPIHPFLIVLLALTIISIGGYVLVLSKSNQSN
ncbi:MAG: hypothetical protein RLN90_13650 [Balneolaceae bacterium]